MYAQVAVENVNCTFDKDYDYSIPQQLEGKALVGCRVAVPFGRGNKARIGIITRLTDSTQGKRIKPISAVLDEAPLLSNEMLSLAGGYRSRPSAPTTKRSRRCSRQG